MKNMPSTTAIVVLALMNMEDALLKKVTLDHLNKAKNLVVEVDAANGKKKEKIYTKLLKHLNEVTEGWVSEGMPTTAEEFQIIIVYMVHIKQELMLKI